MSGVGESFYLQTNGETVRRIVCRGKWKEERSFGISVFLSKGIDLWGEADNVVMRRVESNRRKERD